MRSYNQFIYKGFFLILCLLLQNCMFAQKRSFKYKIVKTAPVFSAISNEMLKRKNSAVQVDSYLPKDYSRFGNVNYTDFLQKAVNENNVVLMPNFPIMVDWRGINLRSNTILIFQNNSKLIMGPNDKTNYQTLNLVNVRNIKIFGPRIEGDRDRHANVKGEWGHGIKIFGCNLIEIYNPDISNCWGDGIYIGRGNSSYSSDIKIIGGRIDNSRRNGISIISCINLLIKDVLISNTNGTAPMAGIDFEPNKPDEELKNINVKNLTTINNGNSGIFIGLMNLRNKTISLNFSGHQDDGALYFPLNIYGLAKGKVSQWGIKGVVNYTNSTWKSPDYFKLIYEGGEHSEAITYNFENNFFNNKGYLEKLNRKTLGASKINVNLK